ncbi:hypothetical protein KFK09_024631 [Dendrobium nobile]|uniref:Uncharacterized protein n=1 Tax=Dendrobium nobile TaxID=94219 RepID=A0A8T3AEJ1_DENNO|nr:hypothetical protein KFK09_024631 [Dendrobium nobile]
MRWLSLYFFVDDTGLIFVTISKKVKIMRTCFDIIEYRINLTKIEYIMHNFSGCKINNYQSIFLEDKVMSRCKRLNILDLLIEDSGYMNEYIIKS